MLNIVHLCMTPLAGAPIRIVQGLNRYTQVRARLINLNPSAYGKRVYDEDLHFGKNREESLDLISQADIIHCHHWIDLKRNPFHFDLSNKRVVRHYHSEPEYASKHARQKKDHLVNEDIPQLVIAQHPERGFPNARPVPNLLNFESLNRVKLENIEPVSTLPIVQFAPTLPTLAAADRWNTKGAPETRAILDMVQKSSRFEVDYFNDLPHLEALRRKANADIVIDEMVTGSYHLSGLEALALGRPTLGYLDSRIIALLSSLTGSSSLPWVNIHLSMLGEVLPYLLKDATLRQQLGGYGKDWMQRHWCTEVLVKHFIKAYEDIMNGMSRLRVEPINEMVDSVLPDFNWLQLTKMPRLERTSVTQNVRPSDLEKVQQSFRQNGESLSTAISAEVAPLRSDAKVVPSSYSVQKNFDLREITKKFTRREHVVELFRRDGVGVELGVAAGDFSERILKYDHISHLFSIDMWAGDRGHGIKQYREAIARLDPYRNRNTVLRMRFDEALPLFNDESLDFIYVDGYAHDGEMNGQTFRDWFPKLRHGGIIAGDDYSPDWPLVVNAVNTFADQNSLNIHVINCHEESWNSKYPTWFALKP